MANLVISESKFQIWRACIAIIYLDKVVTPDEKNWALDKIKKLPFTKEQEQIIRNDLNHGLELESILDKITDKKDLAFLVDTFRVLANIDNDFSTVEKASFQKLESHVLSGLDLKKIEAGVIYQRIELEKKIKNSKDKTLLETMVDVFANFFTSKD